MRVADDIFLSNSELEWVSVDVVCVDKQSVEHLRVLVQRGLL